MPSNAGFLQISKVPGSGTGKIKFYVIFWGHFSSQLYIYLWKIMC